MFNHIKTIVKDKVIRFFFSDFHKPLGRWGLMHENQENINKKIDWSNEDHCGPCGNESLDVYIKKNEKKLKELNEKNNSNK